MAITVAGHRRQLRWWQTGPSRPTDFGVIMSRRDEWAMRNCSHWALRLLTLAATVAMASPVLAQNNSICDLFPCYHTPSRPFQEPSRPFQERAPGGGTGNLPPETMITPQIPSDKLEPWAKYWQSKQIRPVERQTYYVIMGARDPAEFDALAHYGLLVLNVMTQSVDELPVKRVYLRMPDREIPLLKIASWRRDVDQTLVLHKIYPYLEDGFYLFPLSAYLRIAQMQVDFAVNRFGLPLLEFPIQDVPNWLRTMPNPDPPPGTLPNLKALQEFIKRKTSGFPIPTSLPHVPGAWPVPDAVPHQAEEAKKNDKAATSSSR